MTDSSFGWNIIKKPECTEVRRTTNRLLEMLNDGVIKPMDVVEMCLKWMSEDDVKEMCEANGIFPEDEEDED
jgi:hypothetical protein